MLLRRPPYPNQNTLMPSGVCLQGCSTRPGRLVWANFRPLQVYLVAQKSPEEIEIEEAKERLQTKVFFEPYGADVACPRVQLLQSCTLDWFELGINRIALWETANETARQDLGSVIPISEATDTRHRTRL